MSHLSSSHRQQEVGSRTIEKLTPYPGWSVEVAQGRGPIYEFSTIKMTSAQFSRSKMTSTAVPLKTKPTQCQPEMKLGEDLEERTSFFEAFLRAEDLALDTEPCMIRSQRFLASHANLMDQTHLLQVGHSSLEGGRSLMHSTL